MIQFCAHIVLVLRYLLADEMKDTFREKIMSVGDLILYMYFSKTPQVTAYSGFGKNIVRK